VSVRAVELTTRHAAAFEISAWIRTGRGHCGRVSRAIPCYRAPRDHRVLPGILRESLSDACYWPRKHSRSRCWFLIRMMHLLTSLGTEDGPIVAANADRYQFYAGSHCRFAALCGPAHSCRRRVPHAT